MSYIFLWSISPLGPTPNGNYLYLYLFNGQEKVVNCEDF